MINTYHTKLSAVKSSLKTSWAYKQEMFQKSLIICERVTPLNLNCKQDCNHVSSLGISSTLSQLIPTCISQ